MAPSESSILGFFGSFGRWSPSLPEVRSFFLLLIFSLPREIWAREGVEVPLSLPGTGKVYLDLLGDNSVISVRFWFFFKQLKAKLSLTEAGHLEF